MGLMFLPDGSVDQLAFEVHVVAPLVAAATRGLDRTSIWGGYREVVDRTAPLTLREVRLRVAGLERLLARVPQQLGGLLPTDRYGERGREWAFFQRRRDRLVWEHEEPRRAHERAAPAVREQLLALGAAGSAATLRNGAPAGWDLLWRVKAEDRTRAKMERKGLRPWEVGDLLGFFLVVRSLRALLAVARRVDAHWAPDVLYKQDGFHDVLAKGQRLSIAVGRRVFYIIRHNDVVCFELQLVTHRQAISLHLAHLAYLGSPEAGGEWEALDAFGDRAYLLDLLDLAADPASEGGDGEGLHQLRP